MNVLESTAKAWGGPDFLLIGAMKAGTTTLYRDLLSNTGIYFPLDKEPGNLTSDDVLAAPGWAEYRRLYRDAPAGALCGDGSTSYSKLPDVPGVPRRAVQVLRPDFKVIYVVRDPVERAVSHYKHLVVHHGLAVSLEEAVGSVPQLIAYGRYAYQLEPWLELLDRERICVVRFEDFVADRAGVVSRISRFLGVEPMTGALEEDRVFNATESVPVATAGWQRVRRSRWYTRYVRPLLSPDGRERMRSLLLPRAKSPSVRLSASLRRELENRFRDDAMRLASIMATRSPVWSWDATEDTGR